MSAATVGAPLEAPLCGSSQSSDAEDAPFRSRAVVEKVRQHHLWHGDLLADAASFGAFRAWLEERLPRVTQTPKGYFTAALVRGAAFCVGRVRALFGRGARGEGRGARDEGGWGQRAGGRARARRACGGWERGAAAARGALAPPRRLPRGGSGLGGR
jgi:hypothetical protein